MWPLTSPEYRDVARTLARYLRYVEQAAQAGADLLVLPEACVVIDDDSRVAWERGVAEWAAHFSLTVVAGYFDAATRSNELCIVEPGGRSVARYQKQHLAPIEGKRRERMPPALIRLPCGASLSAVICADLDYSDVARRVRQRGGLLAVPANDWPAFRELHHRTAVWAAVLGGAPVVRATGHGICAIFDGAGRLTARRSMEEGPGALIGDVRI
jgi:predicted amidohydrolase